MGLEIERKFLVEGDEWKRATHSVYRQGYLSSDVDRVVRVRSTGDRGVLTIKGRTIGSARPEYEYEIPTKDADEMLDRLCLRPLIEKRRYEIEFGGLTWEVDEFLGANAGLVVAEVELEEENQKIEIPSWIGREVTDDPRFFNSNLVTHPYTEW